MKKEALWVVILEDQKGDSDRLSDFIRQYAKEKKKEIVVSVFRDGKDLLAGFKDGFDVLFMDIELPTLNGMDTAQEVRKRRSLRPLAIVLEVDAMGFMLKPVHYYLFENYLTRAIARAKRIEEQRVGSSISLGSGANLKKVFCDDILYIVKDKNYIEYHLKGEEPFKERGSMKDVLPRFEKTTLKQCQSGCLVNLMHVKRKEGNDVFMDDEAVFTISLPFRKDFTQQLLDYLRGI